jgi:hypothetical protein
MTITHPRKVAYKLLGIYFDEQLSLNFHTEYFSKLTKSEQIVILYQTSQAYYSACGHESFIFRADPFPSCLLFLFNEPSLCYGYK